MAGPNQVNRLRDTTQPVSTRQQDATTQLVNPTVVAVNKTPIGGAKPPSWIRPDIISTSTWAEAGGVGVGLSGKSQLTAYHKDALGYVWTKVSLASAAGVAAFSVPFIYKAGYRPSEVIGNFSVVPLGGGAASLLVVEPDGSLRVTNAVAAGGGFTGYFSFLAEQ